MAYSSTRQSFLAGARPIRTFRRPSQDAREAFPELEPADTGGKSAGLSEHGDRIREGLVSQFRELRDNPDADNALASLTVYALNAVLLILAFPVGFAMLIFNVLVGESLRTTIHVLALTGLAIALSNTEPAARVLGIG